MIMTDAQTYAILLFLLILFIALGAILLLQGRALARTTRALQDALEEKHRAMLGDLHSGLTQQGDRLGASSRRPAG